jgi:hypothetical protein
MKPNFLGNTFFKISEMTNIRNLFTQAKPLPEKPKKYLAKE